MNQHEDVHVIDLYRAALSPPPSHRRRPGHTGRVGFRWCSRYCAPAGAAVQITVAALREETVLTHWPAEKRHSR